MARIPYLDLNDLPPEHQDLLARRANIYRALAHSPNGLRAFSTLGGDIRALMDEAEGRPSGLEPLTKTVLAAASEMTENLAISDATFA